MATQGEDPETCAARLSFAIPPSSAAAVLTISDTAAASTNLIPSIATIQVLAADSSPTSIPAAFFGALGTDIPAATSVGSMTPEYTAPLNQTSPATTLTPGLGAGEVVFTGAARRVDLGTGIGGLLGVAVVAGLVV